MGVVRRPRRIVSIGHSYCVALNRGLPGALASVGAGEWEVTAVAPSFFHGDLRPIHLEPLEGESCRVEEVDARLSRWIHVMHYDSRLREILSRDWDVVHCWEEPYVLSGAQVARLASPHAPLSFSTYQNIPKRYPPPFSWLERYSMRRAAGWIPGGESIREALKDRPGYHDRPARTIPLGVDLDAFRPDAAARESTRRLLGWDGSSVPVVGYLGRFIEAKGVPLLMSVLDRMETPWRALFVGGGPMEETLRQWGAAHGDRVRVITGVSHGEVPAYLNAMDVLCALSQTTRRWREQFGRMLIEAFGCGVPVLSSDSGEMPYVVGDAGVVVGEADEAGWVLELTRLLGSPERRSDLSRRGLERAHARYEWRIVARQHLEFFEELLDAPSNGSR
jgi:glycosyltransferase involved in cell wall biosynthesis